MTKKHNEIGSAGGAGAVGTEQHRHDFCQDTLQMKNSLELHFLEMGKRLMEIRDGKLYEPYWDSFEGYLMEMKWDKSRGSKMINIYKKFVLEYQVEQPKLAAAGGWAVLAEVLPVVKDKESAEEWVQKAIDNPMYELRDEVREARGHSKKKKKDALTGVDGNIALRRSDGSWTAQITDGASYEDLETEAYGPVDTLDELISLIERDHDE